MIPPDLSPLANHLWQSTLFAAAAWLLTLAVRKNRAAVRYWIWLTASVKFLIPFSVLVSIGSQLGWRSAPAITQPEFTIVMKEISRPFAMSADVSTLTAAPSSPNHLPMILLGVWLCGIAIGVISWTRWWWRARGVRRTATPLHLNLPVRVMSSPARLEPGVFGICEPVLLLPQGITERLTPPQLGAILAHELCHIRRRDNLTAAIHMLVETIFWFHPLMWWIRARLVEERERACDEEVLQVTGNPEIYAEGILKVCKFYLETPVICVSGITGSDLRRRIEAIMMNRIAPRLDFSRKVILTATGALALIGPVAVGLVSVPASRAQAQAAAPPAFDVASVKRSQPGGTRTGVGTDPGRLTIRNASLKFCIEWAYGVKDYQVSGPDWLDSDRFDIVAKAGVLALEDRLRLMLRALLADRFKLALHRETKELPVYALTVVKDGVKIHEVSAGMSKSRGGRGHLSGQKVSMLEFADLLTRGAPRDIDRPVIDRTGLKGVFDITLDWMPASAGPLGEAAEGRGAIEAVPGPDIFRALQQQLGLKLESQKGPVEILVIDHAEKVPTAN
jgi:bla regulator protein blaR1